MNGPDIDNLYESYITMLSVCDEHHPEPILSDMPIRAWKEETLFTLWEANGTPRNPYFKHRTDSPKLLGTEIQSLIEFYYYWTTLQLKEQTNN
jgi:hypothetical protein